MHELTLCANVLDTLREMARREGFTRVLRVRLEIGRFACVEPAALRFGFEALSRGTLADGAALDVIERPGRARCVECGADVEATDRLQPCPACGGEGLAPTGGDEMRIRDIEVI